MSIGFFSWAIIVIDVLGCVAKRNGTTQGRRTQYVQHRDRFVSDMSFGVQCCQKLITLMTDSNLRLQTGRLLVKIPGRLSKLLLTLTIPYYQDFSWLGKKFIHIHFNIVCHIPHSTTFIPIVSEGRRAELNLKINYPEFITLIT